MIEEDNICAEEEKPIANVTSEAKPLAVGDRFIRAKPKKQKTQPSQHEIFLENCKQRFGLLLLGTRTPAPMQTKMDWLEMKNTYKDKQLKRVDFICHSPALPGHEYGLTLNAKAVLHSVRTRLKKEYWISKYAIELPTSDLKGTEHHTYNYVNQIFREALQEQRERVLQFLLYLHREHGKTK